MFWKTVFYKYLLHQMNMLRNALLLVITVADTN